MLVSFGDAATSDVYHGRQTARVRAFSKDMLRSAKRKLDMIEYAMKLDDLKVPPGNRLELLKGDLAGFHSIRINEQWRIIFKWAGGNAGHVRIADYH